MSTKFVGKFQQVEHDNFDDFMKELGINFAIRKFILATKPGLECTVNGDDWCITSKGFKDKDTKFKMGVEFDDESADGRKVKALITIDMATEKVTHRERWEGKEAVYTHEITDDGGWLITMKMGGVVATRKYKRL